MNIPTTVDRVRDHSPKEANDAIDRKTQGRLSFYRANPRLIGRRLSELDAEWNIERALEANASTLALAGSLLSLKNRAFLLLPIGVTGFLLQHAVQGWCPPMPVLRRLGFRTPHEIEQERHELLEIRESAGRTMPAEPTTPATVG
jgi:hypothetical protein